ncbi:MAG: hypothetical protein M1368_10675, partial [Thaumarchaeota archaeon]|nr:hypothetical protein [Nitrososphaerota archaeon]
GNQFVSIRVRLLDDSVGGATVYDWANMESWSSGYRNDYSVINYRTLPSTDCLTTGHTYEWDIEWISQANPCFLCSLSVINGTGNSRDYVYTGYYTANMAHIRFYEVQFYY